jgi:hypothetical protein
VARRVNSHWSSGLGSLGVLFWVSSSLAEPTASDRVAADALFIEARDLMRKGDYTEACPKLRDSQRLDPGVGTLLNLALCYEENGKTASAWSTYQEAAAAARAAGHTAREEVARERAKLLEPKLSRLVIASNAQLRDSRLLIEIELDGRALPQTLWDTPLPVDPGKHAITVTARGKRIWLRNVVVESGARLRAEVPPLEAETTMTRAAVVPKEPGEGTPKQPDRRVRSVAALAIGGAGVIGVAAGGVLGVAAKARYDESEPECGKVCTRRGQAIRDDAYDTAALSMIAFVAGGAALAGGAVLWFAAAPAGTKSAGSAPRVGIGVVATPEARPVTVSVVGRF